MPKYHCIICNTSIQWYRLNINNQVLKQHNLSLVEYGIGHQNQKRTTSTTVVCSVTKDSLNNSLNSADTPEHISSGGKRLWYDRCLYKCGSCSKTFVNVNMARGHTKKINHQNYTTVSAPKYECKICNGSILCCRTQIKLHVLILLGLSVNQYGEMYEKDQDSSMFQVNTVPQRNENQHVTEEPQAKKLCSAGAKSLID